MIFVLSHKLLGAQPCKNVKIYKMNNCFKLVILNYYVAYTALFVSFALVIAEIHSAYQFL